MSDLINNCTIKENYSSAKDRMNALYYETKYFGNSALGDIRAGNLKIQPATDIYAAEPNIAEKPEFKQKSKFKQFLSRIGNSFKNFFRLKERN